MHLQETPTYYKDHPTKAEERTIYKTCTSKWQNKRNMRKLETIFSKNNSGNRFQKNQNE